MSAAGFHALPEGLGASFRDPSGVVFTADGGLYRQVNLAYRNHYDHLMGSGLYQSLVDEGLLIPHREVEGPLFDPATCYKILQPERVQFISYPYEWCFSQLKEAAQTTLEIQKRAFAHGMTLKDCSAYNIQFHQGRAVLIDSLSFEIYQEGEPWTPYRQFCQHFLAPLSLMAYTDVRLSQLLRVHLDGIPLDLTSRLLPRRTRLNLPLLLHIHLHAASQKRFASRAEPPSNTMSRLALQGLIDSLETTVRRLRWRQRDSAWGGYYRQHQYSAASMAHKQQLVADFLKIIQPRTVWDLGANTGVFSRLASSLGSAVIAFDLDIAAVEQNYLECRAAREKKVLPLVLDLTNPSPALGWNHRERLSLLQRAPAEALLALALIHHLAIGNNLPLERLAGFFSQLGSWLIIEFVPKSDPQVQRMLSSRRDIFPDYTPETFERVFAAYYHIRRSEAIRESERRLYLMERQALENPG